MVDWNMQSGRELLVVFAVQGDRGESGIIHRLCTGSEAGQPCQAPRTSWHWVLGITGDFLFVLKVRLIKKLSSLLILCLLHLASDMVTRTGLFPNLWELGKSEMLLGFKAVRLGFYFCGLLTDGWQV